MKCIDCKWFAGTHNDTYGVCKRYPHIENKSQQDWCGEFASKIVVVTPAQEESIQPITIKFEEPTEYNIYTDEIKPKRGRKPKA
jgi:hypothetical protein